MLLRGVKRSECCRFAAVLHCGSGGWAGGRAGGLDFRAERQEKAVSCKFLELALIKFGGKVAAVEGSDIRKMNPEISGNMLCCFPFGWLGAVWLNPDVRGDVQIRVGLHFS